MEKKEEIIVLDTSDEAAQLKTITGWVSRDGRFYGNDERTARYAGSTHSTCSCGKLMTRMYTKCESCIRKQVVNTYDNLPFKEWDGVEPVCLYGGDEYFFSPDDVEWYLEDNELKPEDIMLVICEPNYLQAISSDYWEDVLHEDQDIPDELKKLVEEVNKYIESSKPISWSPGKTRTIFNPNKQ
jgi:hypothetical protein